jgi:hypothetical protein
MYPNARSPLDAYDWHTSDGVPAGGHDSHSSSLQTSPGSNLTKFNPYQESGRISETDLAICVYGFRGSAPLWGDDPLQ